MNVWNRHPDDWIVIPTNAGWRWNGQAVMGAGLALDAHRVNPGLANWYGRQLMESRNPFGCVSLWEPTKLVLFPTKPLNPSAPHLSWQEAATLDCIRSSVDQLKSLLDGGRITGRVLVPPVGCGLGGLSIDQVRPILEPLLPMVTFTWEV